MAQDIFRKIVILIFSALALAGLAGGLYCLFLIGKQAMTGE